MINKLSHWDMPIAWQRILLGFLILAIGLHFLWRNSTVSNTLSAVEFNPPVLSANFDNIQYEKIEDAFAELRFQRASLVLDASTESQLSLVLEQLPEGFEQAHLDRIGFLLAQQFDLEKSHAITDLITKLAVYKREELAWWEKQSANTDTHMDINHFDSLFELQDKLLGSDVAQSLYGEQRRLTRIMAGTQAIESDSSLSEEQKQQALAELMKTLESSSTEPQ